MYIPAHFAENRLEVLHDLIRGHSLATLVVYTPEGLVANHIPMLIDPEAGSNGTLRGHVARANPVWKLADAEPVLVIFQGPEHYITPNWYAEKPRSGKVVPTWNYAVVHCHGSLLIRDTAEAALANVSALSATHEATQPQPWQVSDAPPDYIEKMLAAIVAFDIPIDRIEGKWKVSQNRSREDRGSVENGLLAADSEAAAAMAALVGTFRSRA